MTVNVNIAIATDIAKFLSEQASRRRVMNEAMHEGRQLKISIVDNNIVMHSVEENAGRGFGNYEILRNVMSLVFQCYINVT